MGTRLGDETFALRLRLVKSYKRRQLSREEIAVYRMSRGRRVVENVLGILLNRFRVLLNIMEQNTKDARDIALTCVTQHPQDTSRRIKPTEPTG